MTLGLSSGVAYPSLGTTSNAPLSVNISITEGTLPFVDVRCPSCGKLICKWEFTGIASLEVKCSRCGSINVIRLSTM